MPKSRLTEHTKNVRSEVVGVSQDYRDPLYKVFTWVLMSGENSQACTRFVFFSSTVAGTIYVKHVDYRM